MRRNSQAKNIMKFKIIFSLFAILFLSDFGLSQDTKSRLKFAVLDGNGNFLSSIKTTDIQIEGFKDLSLNLVTDKPLEIMILIDASASQERMLPWEKKAAQTFINDFMKAGKDKAAVVNFTGKIALEQDLTNDLQKAVEKIGKIEFVPPGGYVGGGISVGKTPSNKDQLLSGSTSIWDSLKQVLEAVSKMPDNDSQRAIILISDGVNTFGETKTKEVVELSVKTEIPIYAIGIGDDYYDGVDKKTLIKITEETGGIAIVPKKELKDLSQLLKSFEQSLRSRYELTFSQNSSTSIVKLQKTKIEFVNPELQKKKLQIIQPKGIFVSN